MNTKVQSAVASMLPNGRSNGPATVKIEESKLPPEARKVSYKAIDEAYEIQVRKGGIEDTQNLLKGLQDKVGEKVYVIAKEAIELGNGRMEVCKAWFLALCASAEQHLRATFIAKHKEEPPAIGQLIPQWSNYKSIIGKGFDLKLNPLAIDEVGKHETYPTASDFRAAVQKASQATGSQAGSTRASNASSPVLSLIDRGWAPSLAQSMQVLCEGLNSLSKEEQERTAPWVAELANRVHAYHEEIMAAQMVPTGESGGAEPLDEGTKAALQVALDKDDKTGERKGGKRRTA